MRPTVSVVVATYKRPRELKLALDSLAEQSYHNFEIVVVDDSAEPELCAAAATTAAHFRETCPEIPLRLIRNEENRGSAETRNIGIRAAQGEYVTFLDDDDLYLPQKLARQTAFMQENALDYSITDLELFSDAGTLIERRTRTGAAGLTGDALRSYHLKYHLTGTDTLMFRRDYLTAIGGFAPIDVGDEFYLMLRAIDGGGRFGYLPVCDVKAFVHTGEGGLSSGESKIEGENALYRFKQRYFPDLSAADRRYIRMRHQAVLAYAYLRQKKPLQFLRSAAGAFLSDPAALVRMALGRRE